MPYPNTTGSSKHLEPHVVKVNPLITIIACKRGAIHEHSSLGYVIISCIALVTRALTNIVCTWARKIQGRHKVGRTTKRGGENRRVKRQR